MFDIAYVTKPPTVQFSRSVASDSLRPHELQHARPPCLSESPKYRVQRVALHAVS